MSKSPLRLVGLLAGDLYNDPTTKIKYGLFFAALARQYDLVGVHDASLRGFSRFWNAVQVFHPSPRIWRKRYWQNVPAFRSRSKIASRYLQEAVGMADLGFQMNALFDARLKSSRSLPTVIYTDYTAYLSSLRPEAGRSPFTADQLKKWLELERQTYKKAAHIFTRAQFVRRSIVDFYNIPPERVTAVGGGVNFEEWPDVNLQSSQADPVVLFIGRDFYRKGGDILLEAFARAHRQHPSAKLIFLTRDPIPQSFPLDGVEVLYTGWDRKKVNECFRRANIFVLPSRLETWGDVLLEAMAYGIASIGVNVEPMTEIVEDGRTGLLVEPDNAEALGDGLVKLFKDIELRKRLAEASRDFVQNNYSWDHVVHRMAPKIQEIGLITKGEE